MPLQENPNLANKQKPQPVTRSVSLIKKPAHSGNILSVMKTKSRAFISVPADFVRPRSHGSDPSIEPPLLTVDDADSPMSSMSQTNGFLKEQSPSDVSRIPSGRIVSPSLLRSATLSLAEPPPTPETSWSSAIGHASTGKSGRVIERLQGDIDRLRREKQLLKVQFEEVEKTNETLVTRNQYLQDRNSNYEHTHETSLRQLERKERQVQDLREELKREKANTARAEEAARLASASEESWKDHANQARAKAEQRETEYNTIVMCRNADNTRHQGGLLRIRTNFEALLRQREEDLDKQKKLDIIAEQQTQTIQQLEDFTRRLNANFKAYRAEIDTAIAELRRANSGNDMNVNQKLQEMTKVTGEMKWVMNVEREVNHRYIPLRSQQQQEQCDDHGRNLERTPASPPSPARRNVISVDMKGKQGRKKLGKGSKS